jgi:lysophospholipase L1-like esterase
VVGPVPQPDDNLADLSRARGGPDVTEVILSALSAVVAVAASVFAGVSPASASAPASVSVSASASASAEGLPAAPLRVMPLGDSITMGIGSATMSSYRIDLQNRLAAAGLRVDFVGSQRDGAPATADLDHEGHSGWTIAKISSQVNGWLADSRPDAVLLQIGTNDLRTAAGSVGATGRLSALIDQIKTAAPAAEILVAKISGTKSAGAADQQKRTDAYNARVPRIVAGKGAHVHLVDQSTVKGIDIRDGLHPNDFGYAKMSWNWFQAMAPIYRLSTSRSKATNPYASTRGNFCHLVDNNPGPAWDPYFDCRWYYKNLVRKVWTWQTKRLVSERRKVRVKDHYETRTVKASKWVSFDPDRHDR